MLTCPICGEAQLSIISELISHIRLFHAGTPGFWLQCNLQGCKRTFTHINTYRNHVYAYHNMSVIETNDCPSPDPEGIIIL